MDLVFVLLFLFPWVTQAESIHDRVHSIPPQNQGPGSPSYHIQAQWKRHGILGLKAFYDRKIIWLTGHTGSWKTKQKALQIARSTVGSAYELRDCIATPFSKDRFNQPYNPHLPPKASHFKTATRLHDAQVFEQDRLLEWQIARLIYRTCGASVWKTFGIHVKDGHLTMTLPTKYTFYWPRIRNQIRRFPLRSIHYAPYFLKP